ncbi:MAG: HTTM domain-containing protein [Bacteroidetes bacterium]|nr:HTTM domain-containing protein [Bacteroidota bacterium]
MKSRSQACFFYFYTIYQLKKILFYLSKSYTLDLRALALMRIGIALIIIADLLIRGSDLSAHYTDAGLWPTNLIHTFGWKAGNWSLHELSGSYAWALFLFCLHFVFALFLLFGYRTKLATLLVWLLTISLHNRNLFVQQSGDDLLRLLLFWGLFLPWNAFYSLDSKKQAIPLKQNTLANIGYLLLIASVYFFTVSLKTSAEWRAEGSAIYYALSLEQLRLPAGDLLYQYPTLMKLFTWFVFYTELSIPLLILWPSKKGKLRLIAFVLILILHIGIGLTLYVGLFYIINIVGGLALLPKHVLDKVESKLNTSSRSARVKKQTLVLSIKKTSPIRYITNGICIFVIIISIIINLSAVNWFGYELRKEIWYPVNVFRLDQYWGMFSPSILKKDGWFVYHGMDSIGRQWDLYRNNEYVNYKKPEHIVKMYKSDRWRKLAENMQNDNYTFLRPLYCRYIIREWNIKHPNKKMNMLNFFYMEKQNLPDYKSSEVKKNLFCVCNDN